MSSRDDVGLHSNAVIARFGIIYYRSQPTKNISHPELHPRAKSQCNCRFSIDTNQARGTERSQASSTVIDANTPHDPTNT